MGEDGLLMGVVRAHVATLCKEAYPHLALMLGYEWLNLEALDGQHLH